MPKLIKFRGRDVIEGWPKRLKAAQLLKRYDGLKNDRVPYEGRQCHDCSAYEGELHVPGCDTERCGDCGGQAIMCGCVEDE
jgi:hypothetical protein